MGRLITARISDEAADELERASQRLGLSQDEFLEEAILLRAERDQTAGSGPGLTVDEKLRLLQTTAGAWERADESPDQTIENVRQASGLQYRRHLEPGAEHW